MEAFHAQQNDDNDDLEEKDHPGRNMLSPTPRSAAMTRRDAARRAALGAAGLCLVGLLAACGSGGAEDDETPVTGVTEVAVRDNYFEPAVIEVRAGTTVTWRWDGDHPHNVVGDDFESEIQTEGTFAHAFAALGRYDYRCTLHGGMRGAVVVTEGT